MKKKTVAKLVVIVSAIVLLAGCVFSKEHVHSIVHIDKKDSTCTEEGNIEYYRCTVCGASFSDEKGQNPLENVSLPVNPSAHSISRVERKDSTCTVKGNIDHYKCTGCEATFRDEKGQNPIADVSLPINPSAHSISRVDKKNATLDADGYEAHWKCTRCEKLFKNDDGTNEIAIESLIIPKGFAKIMGGIVTSSIGDKNGPFSNASTIRVSMNAFYMAMTETTYEKWYEVYTWATAPERGANKYTFVNKGREGNDGTIGAEPTAAKLEPVTTISWRDAVVWCNAASEMEGKTPVYYLEGTTEISSDNVVRTSQDSMVANDYGIAEKAVIRHDVNGYRLPTEAEWEYAARGGNPDAVEWSYTYAGGNYLGDYAVYLTNSEGKTAIVGTKLANSAGLYDMSGNVWEWCQDIYVGQGRRVYRGGCWCNNSTNQTVAYRTGEPMTTTSIDYGFRVVCAANSN